LLFGFWTPVAGVLLAMVEIFLAFAHSRDTWIYILLAALGVALAMLGPGVLVRGSPSTRSEADSHSAAVGTFPLANLTGAAPIPEWYVSHYVLHARVNLVPLEREEQPLRPGWQAELPSRVDLQMPRSILCS
jgi:hypothetical protein